jgi:glycosyltransferase involved in cell wall biosynthesis
VTDRDAASRDPAATEANFALLTVFFPMWNEEAYIDRALAAAREACEILLAEGEIADYELLIVDDASTDATPQLADAFAAADPRIRVVHHPVNRKLGGSLKTGFAESRGDLILYSDADLPFDMDELVKACRVMRHYDADIVSAYRLDRTGEGYLRTIYSTIYNGLVRLLFGVRMRDINFAFKLCRRQVFETVTLASEGSFIDAELVIRAMRNGQRVVQFGVDYFPRTRGLSTLSSPAVIRKLLKEMMMLRKELRDISRDVGS